MNTIKKFIGAWWAAWALFMFIVTMLFFMIPFLLFCYTVADPLRNKRFITYSRTWMRIYLFSIGCPLTVKGTKHFKPGEVYIVLCNHNSFMDVPVSSPAIPGGNKTIAKIEIAKTPIFGMLYKTGSVLVDRKSDASRKESFNKMKAVLEMGLHMCIYPEGTRNKSDEPLKPFHNGAFRLAVETKKSIIPAVIFNSKKVLPPDKGFFLDPHPLSIHFLEAIPVGENETAESLNLKSFETMREYYVKHQRH